MDKRFEDPDKKLLNEVCIAMLRWRIARDRAREIILESGWTETDEDFEFQVEDEAKRQWDEDYDREMRKFEY